MNIVKILEHINESRGITGLGGVKLKIYKMLLKHECTKRNSYIPDTLRIGKNVCFPHGIMGVFISQGALIGDNVTIFHQVTIGSNTLKDSKNFGAPIIGNNVYIGAGAKIIGKVIVGDNVRIGANAVVTTDIPANATVVSEKPRIIKYLNARDNKFVKYSVRSDVE